MVAALVTPLGIPLAHCDVLDGGPRGTFCQSFMRDRMSDVSDVTALTEA